MTTPPSPQQPGSPYQPPQGYPNHTFPPSQGEGQYGQDGSWQQDAQYPRQPYAPQDAAPYGGPPQDPYLQQAPYPGQGSGGSGYPGQAGGASGYPGQASGGSGYPGGGSGYPGQGSGGSGYPGQGSGQGHAGQGHAGQGYAGQGYAGQPQDQQQAPYAGPPQDPYGRPSNAGQQPAYAGQAQAQQGGYGQQQAPGAYGQQPPPQQAWQDPYQQQPGSNAGKDPFAQQPGGAQWQPGQPPAARKKRGGKIAGALGAVGIFLVIAVIKIGGVFAVREGVGAVGDQVTGAPRIAHVGDCMAGQDKDSLKVVDCKDATVEWKVARKVNGKTEAQFNADTSLSMCHDKDVTTAYWEGPKSGAMGYVLCLVPLKKKDA
ncbi:LppU/SCO3897 family protein [Sphaerisporangium viridialbum]|uniref:LppU/SCO3897 family protein n=1 Tax=Sphaerisporangium viridialbum TaxID=46189 RepID=UPI003C776FEF